MRVAFFSPLPPERSGIADYSAALLGPLRALAEIDVIASAEAGARPSDIALYQIGNNRHHAFVYEAALRQPGVIVLHEANLHHLIADLTIRRADWDAYVTECEYSGGPEARAYAERVRRLETGPDYEGVTMLRRLLESALGVIVHSHYVEAKVRAAGYGGPVAVIPHGANAAVPARNEYRHKLGLDEIVPLVGIFGFLKPYKRIHECLRAFRRLVRVAPTARMILCGEPHPDLPLEAAIQALHLSAHVRVLGFVPSADFEGYLGACDAVLNLRFPTVGETSGTLLRAMGLGKPVVVSDIGAFGEFPDDACLKAPVGPGEEDAIFEYLDLLASRPEAAQAIGARARECVVRECSWELAARRYTAFLEAVANGREWQPEPAPAPEAPPAVAPERTSELSAYLRTWAADESSRQYLETHATRLVKTLELIPPGSPGDRILEMGAYLQLTPALTSKLGYGSVRGCYYGPAGRTDLRTAVSAEGERFACEIDHFDASADRFPYPDGHFRTVLCCELIEHLSEDPMHMMSEVNRILAPGGYILLTTPNAASLRAIAAVLQGYHPGFFPAYLRPPDSGGALEARHNREYTAREIGMLLADSGFETVRLETGEFRDAPHPEHAWVKHLLERYRLDMELRGDGIYALGRKTGPVKTRRPVWLYS